MKSGRLLTLILLSCFFYTAHPQQHGTGPREKSAMQELKTNKHLRKEKRAKRKLEKAERKAVEKHHKRLQTKKVRKRMKSGRKEAMRHNDNKREVFYKRWFKKKHRSKQKNQAPIKDL